MSEATFRPERFRKTFLLLLLVTISLVFVWVIEDFITPIILAAIFSGLCMGVFDRFVHFLAGRTNLAAGLTLLLFLAVLIVPLLLFMGIVAGQAVQVSTDLRPWLQEQMSTPSPGDLSAHIRLPDFLVPYQTQIYSKLAELTSMLGQFLLASLAAATRGTASFLFALFVMLYAMFFFLRDGRTILAQILYYMPLETSDELRMVDRFSSVTRATLKGTLIIGIIQGALAGSAFAVLGIQGAAFWGTVMAVLSIIPGIGTALIWVPAAIFLGINGNVPGAVGLTFWCVAVVGTVDNLLRPRLVGRDTKMSDLMIMLSTLGGLFAFGAAGLFMGPIIAALFVTIWEIYGEAFREYLPPVLESELHGSTAPQDSKQDPAAEN